MMLALGDAGLGVRWSLYSRTSNLLGLEPGAMVVGIYGLPVLFLIL
jgi:hypothetical protein